MKYSAVLLAFTAALVTANINFWAADMAFNAGIGTIQIQTEHFTVAGTDGQTCCDAWLENNRQGTGENALWWITNAKDYCGRKYRVKGKEFWLTKADQYPNACSNTAVAQKLPFGLVWDASNGAYIGWCQGMGNDFTSKQCGNIFYYPFPLNRSFKFQCYTSWVSKRGKMVKRGAPPLPPAEYNITIPDTLPSDWITLPEESKKVKE